jgi:hypothetical protein
MYSLVIKHGLLEHSPYCRYFSSYKPPLGAGISQRPCLRTAEDQSVNMMIPSSSLWLNSLNHQDPYETAIQPPFETIKHHKTIFIDDVPSSKASFFCGSPMVPTTMVPTQPGCRERAWPGRVAGEDIGAWGSAIASGIGCYMAIESWICPLKTVIFHSSGTVYQRVCCLHYEYKTNIWIMV